MVSHLEARVKGQRHSRRRPLCRRFGSSTTRGSLCCLLLLLQEAMDLEPVRASSIATATLGHAHHEALAEAACLAGGAVLLVDHALTVVLALGDRWEIVVWASKKWLRKGKRVKVRLGLIIMPQLFILWLLRLLPTIMKDNALRDVRNYPRMVFNRNGSR